MKKILSLNFTITTVLLLLCVMISGIAITYAKFSDRDSKESVTAYMATVDIELLEPPSQTFTESSDTVSFLIENNSNINTYLRVGIIFELISADGEPVIADTRGISVIPHNTEWKEKQEKFTIDNIEYIKWFLEYGNGSDYTEVNPYEDIAASFSITGIPDDCELIVNVVPEAVQVDDGNNALKDFKDSSNINPPW